MTQGNFFTGTTAGGDTLTVTDGTTTNTDVRKIIVSAGTITASSGHTVTVTTGGGGGGGIGGTIAVTQVAYGSGANTIKGEAAFTYTEGTDTLSVGVVATTGTGVSVGGTGTITTNNGSISAGGASGSVAANTTVAAGTTVTGGTGVTATTGNVTASAGQVQAVGYTGGDITDAGIVVADNSLLQRTYTDFTDAAGISAGTDFCTLLKAGTSIWFKSDNAVFNQSAGGLDISNPSFKGLQFSVTAGAPSVTVTCPINAGGADPGGVSYVIANGAAQAPGGAGVSVTIPPFETAIFVVLGNLSGGSDYGGGTYGSRVVQVLGNVTLAAV